MTDIKKYINTSNIGFFIFPIIIFGLYFSNPFSIFVKGNELSFVFVIISCFTIEYFIKKAKDGQKIYMRPIPAMKAMEEAVGRSTEMGTSVLYVPGISGLDQIDTISGILCGEIHTPGDVYEQLASRQEWITSSQIQKAVTKLYYDHNNMSLKKGSGGKGGGSARRLSDVLKQFNMNYDFYAIKSDDLINLLPKEFDRFK